MSQTTVTGDAVAVISRTTATSGPQEAEMTKKVVDAAQQYLTVVREERASHIVDIQMLFKRHPPERVPKLLRDLHTDCRKELRRLIGRDKTDPNINELVAKCFRLKMAINTIRNGMEVKIYMS